MTKPPSIAIEGPYLGKAAVCMPILRSLPDWFAVEETLCHYSTEIDGLPTFLASDTQRVVGFVSLKQHNPDAAEIYVMGLSPEMHRKGIGRELMNRAQEWLRSRDIEYLQVKTLAPSRPDESYAKTRAFYASMGFKPLQELEQIWGEEDPCLVMIKRL